MKPVTGYFPLIGFFLVVQVFAASAQNTPELDTIYFKNQTQQVGVIIQETETLVIMDVFGVPAAFPKSHIDSIVHGSEGRIAQPVRGATSVFDDFDFTAFSGEIAPVTETVQAPEVTQGTMTIPQATPANQIEQEIEEIPLLPVLLPQGNIYQVEANNLKLRAGPETQYNVVGTLLNRTLLVEIESLDRWVHVKTTKGEQGWVHSNFITALQKTPVLVTGNQVNLRVNPGTIYQTVTRLNKGDMVVKVEEQLEWWRVVTGEAQTGWIHQRYLKLLDDPSLYQPKMSLVRNNEAGMPVLIQRVPEVDARQSVTLTVRDDMLTLNGIIKLLILHANETLFTSESLQYSSENILKRQRIESSSAMVRQNLPEALAMQYIGADVFTMLGKRVEGHWEYNITLPDQPGIAFALSQQQGANRGRIVLVPIE